MSRSNAESPRGRRRSGIMLFLLPTTHTQRRISRKESGGNNGNISERDALVRILCKRPSIYLLKLDLKVNVYMYA